VLVGEIAVAGAVARWAFLICFTKRSSRMDWWQTPHLTKRRVEVAALRRGEADANALRAEAACLE
jgi:hypothetical protein